jgi:hypothetical protein
VSYHLILKITQFHGHHHWLFLYEKLDIGQTLSGEIYILAIPQLGILTAMPCCLLALFVEGRRRSSVL